MIWPRRRRTSPEALLWDHLDACQIPFRAPLGDWVEQFHLTATVWSDGLDDCIPHPQASLIAGLDAPIRAQISERTDFDVSPNYLWGAVQTAGSFQLNYARAIAGLTKLFGNGQETSASNTVAREWRFGHARLGCTVWPPDRQEPGRNDRHKLFPETVEEALITIRPAWRPPLEPEALAACADATSLWARPDPSPAPHFGRFTRDWPRDIAALPEGIALSGDSLLAVSPDNIVDVIPRAQLSGLSLSRLTPGRGGAGCDLSVQFSTNTRAGKIIAQRQIAALSGSAAGLDALAETLAARLDLPLKTWTGASD